MERIAAGSVGYVIFPRRFHAVASIIIFWADAPATKYQYGQYNSIGADLGIFIEDSMFSISITDNTLSGAEAIEGREHACASSYRLS